MIWSENSERASSIPWRACGGASANSAGIGSRRTVSPLSPSK